MICKHQVVGKDKNGFFFIHPCGQCLACRVNDTRSWYVRSRFEIKKLERPFQYFLTLTYADEYLPEDGLCHKRDLKLFLNNLNTSFGLSMRYFATSDYGSLNQRPHYHAIILSVKKLGQSKVERIWKKGFVYLKRMNINNIKYTLRYTVKKTPFDGSLAGWFRLISKGWGDNFMEFYTGQEYLVFDGKKYSIPLYYVRKYNLPHKEVDKSIYYDRFYLEHRDVLGGENSAMQDTVELFNLRRKYHENL